MLGEEDS
jgi:hypothetical protein